jgi:hypothetical protein
MAKQSQSGKTDKGQSAGPSIAALPNAGTDASLLEFLTGVGSSAKPPVAESKPVGLPGLPQSKRGNS